MPVATSRRRKSARQASSDIEEDQATQAVPVRDDVDEDEDDAPQRTRVKKEKKTTVKKEKGKAKATAKEEPEDEEDDDDDRIDAENFADQPLTKADCAKINGLAADWLSVEELMHQPSPIITNAATAMADVAGEEAQEGVAELDRVMKDLLDIQALMKGHSKVLRDIIQDVATGEDITNAKEKYLSLVDDMNAEYDQKTTRQKYLTNEQYVSFKEGVYEAQHSGSAMPPMTDFIPREEGDESDDDDDVVMGGVTQEYKCPLMMTILKDPLTSSVCKHSFSGEALKDYFKSARGVPKPCPTSGCSKKFTLADCHPNPDLARKIKAYERRQKRAQEDSDAEEVID